MATLQTTLTVEMDELHDALDLLADIHGRLARRHGDVFRRLDLEIDHFLDDADGCVDMHDIGGGVTVVAPSGRLTEILRQARALGITT